MLTATEHPLPRSRANKHQFRKQNYQTVPRPELLYKGNDFLSSKRHIITCISKMIKIPNLKKVSISYCSYGIFSFTVSYTERTKTRTFEKHYPKIIEKKMIIKPTKIYSSNSKDGIVMYRCNNGFLNFMA